MQRLVNWWVRLPEDRQLAYVAAIVVGVLVLAVACQAHAGNPFTGAEQMTQTTAPEDPSLVERGEALVLKLMEYGWQGVAMVAVLAAAILGFIYLRFTPHGRAMNKKTNAALKPWKPEEREILEYLIENEKARRAHGE